jgi:hypothetical protein
MKTKQLGARGEVHFQPDGAQQGYWLRKFCRDRQRQGLSRLQDRCAAFGSRNRPEIGSKQYAVNAAHFDHVLEADRAWTHGIYIDI